MHGNALHTFWVYIRTARLLSWIRDSIPWEKGENLFAASEDRCIKAATMLLYSKNDFLWKDAKNILFQSSQKTTFLTLTVKSARFWLKTQQLSWTTLLSQQKLPCSCDKLDFWHFLLFHGGSSSGKFFPRIYRCRRNTVKRYFLYAQIPWVFCKFHKKPRSKICTSSFS